VIHSGALLQSTADAVGVTPARLASVRAIVAALDEVVRSEGAGCGPAETIGRKLEE